MPWDFIVSVCTVMGGFAAAIAVYQFFRENISHTRSRSAQLERFVHARSHTFAANAQDYLQFRQEMYRWLPDKESLAGMVLVFSKRAQSGKEVHLCEHRRWAMRNTRPLKSAPILCFQHARSRHRLFVSLLVVPAGSYVVWIGKTRPPAFEHPTAVSVFPGQITELFLR